MGRAARAVEVGQRGFALPVQGQEQKHSEDANGDDRRPGNPKPPASSRQVSEHGPLLEGQIVGCQCARNELG